MFQIKKKNGNLDGLEKEIDSLLEDMIVEGRDSEAYSRMAESLERICKAKSYEKTSDPVDWNGIILNFLGCALPVLLILNYEQLNVLTSKAFQLVKKVH